ncbi:hypothetical protein [Caulobacter sp. 17J65-9]|uniref:hypothetical protein n=1 Tax=Caulobacter sp. 17J65-9 TaxID=2709382 RepID=UPI0013CB1E90|nr:hypothetical protein [Caulobacter sp. 17J65-9]NEX92340.1 hypothetical protein [Caulobacter sp. 17J65-9]
MTTLITCDADIDRIGLGVTDRTLPKAEWTHAGHFAAALWLWRRRPASALSDIPGLIRAYNLATGVENTDTGGYHETITLASMRGARAELSRRPADTPLHEVLDSLLASELGRSDWPLAYWSKPVLFSVEARRTWVEPDLRPLPF